MLYHFLYPLQQHFAMLRVYRFISFRAVSHLGPIALLDGRVDDDDLQLAARLVARFGKGCDAERVTVEITDRDRQSRTMDVPPLGRDDIPSAWYI